MLSLFPIHFLAPLAYMLLRLCIGYTFLHFASTHIKHRRSFTDVFCMRFIPGSIVVYWMILVECIIGALFVLGLFTQVAALAGIVYTIKFLLIFSKNRHPLHPTRLSLVLLLFISLSLFVTGPGIFAFDLPI